MEFVTLRFDDYFERHLYYDSSSQKMYALGYFFATDVGCSISTWDDWIYDDIQEVFYGNITVLEKFGSNIYLAHMFEDAEDCKYTDLETTNDKISISPDNLSRLIKDWKEKVCKQKPPTVTITENEGIFILVISDIPIELPKKSQCSVNSSANSVTIDRYVEPDFVHILGIELDYERRTQPQMGAFHHDRMNTLEKSNIVKFDKKIMHKNNFYSTKLLFNDVTIKQTVSLFPSFWSSEQIMDAIFEAYDEYVQRKEVIQFGEFFIRTIRGQSKSGMIIEIVILKNGKMIAAYPVLNEENKDGNSQSTVRYFWWLWLLLCFKYGYAFFRIISCN